MKKAALLSIFICTLSWQEVIAQQGKPEDTEIWKPIPKVVTTSAINAPPSDAIILFGGKNLNEWASVSDSNKAAGWTVASGNFTVKKGTGDIRTKRVFTDYQLHLEWRTPANITGKGQARGNSGLFLASPDNGNDGYELQILDCYKNTTYVNGQTGSIYKQIIPLANACKKPGQWQTYDIVWTAPRFNADSTLKDSARITAFQNGVLIQNNVVLKGLSRYTGLPEYKAHGASCIKLQDHGDPSEPLSFRNIWIREL